MAVSFNEPLVRRMTMTTQTIQPIKKIDWRWVGIGYCFFVVFHLLPSYLLFFVSPLLAGRDMTAKGGWLFLGLALVGCFIGYRSKGVTILEPALSSLAYLLTLSLLFEQFWGRSINTNTVGLMIAWAAVGFVIAFVSAWVGEIIQARREAKKSAPV